MSALEGAGFDPEKVVDSGFYLAGDPISFKESLLVLERRGCRISPAKTRLARLVNTYEKTMWSPSDLQLGSLEREGAMSGYEATHMAMHVLIAGRFGFETKGRPLLTMLSESMAGATDYYYELCFNRGWRNRSPRYKRFEHRARQCKLSFKRMYRKDLETPFEAYRETVHTHLAATRIIVEQTSRAMQGSEADPAALLRRLAPLKRLIFLHEKDFGSFAGYVIARCGMRSTTADRRDFKQALQCLDKSRSMPELIQNLSTSSGALRSG